MTNRLKKNWKFTISSIKLSVANEAVTYFFIYLSTRVYLPVYITLSIDSFWSIFLSIYASFHFSIFSAILCISIRILVIHLQSRLLLIIVFKHIIETRVLHVTNGEWIVYDVTCEQLIRIWNNALILVKCRICCPVNQKSTRNIY